MQSHQEKPFHDATSAWRSLCNLVHSHHGSRPAGLLQRYSMTSRRSGRHIRRVLVATDGSRSAAAALRFAAGLASCGHAALTVISVATRERPMLRPDEPGQARLALSAAVRDLRRRKVAATFLLVQGRPGETTSEAIARESERLKADLVIVGSEGRDTLQEWVVGGVGAAPALPGHATGHRRPLDALAQKAPIGMSGPPEIRTRGAAIEALRARLLQLCGAGTVDVPGRGREGNLLPRVPPLERPRFSPEMAGGPGSEHSPLTGADGAVCEPLAAVRATRPTSRPRLRPPGRPRRRLSRMGRVHEPDARTLLRRAARPAGDPAGTVE